MGDRDDEEAIKPDRSVNGFNKRRGWNVIRNIPVAVVRNTSQRVVPGQESSQETKEATSLDDGWVGLALGVPVEVTDAEQEESKIEGEEEQEEGDCRPERADEEDGSEDEPTLRSR